MCRRSGTLIPSASPDVPPVSLVPTSADLPRRRKPGRARAGRIQERVPQVLELVGDSGIGRPCADSPSSRVLSLVERSARSRGPQPRRCCSDVPGGFTDVLFCPPVRLFLTTPAGHAAGKAHLSQAFVALHRLNRGRQPLILSWRRSRGELGLGVELPSDLRPLVAGLLYGAQPALRIETDEGETRSAEGEGRSAVIRIHPLLLPQLVRVLDETPDAPDPLGPLMTLIGSPGAGWELSLDMHVVPAGKRAIRRLARSLALRTLPRIGAWYARSESSDARLGRLLSLALRVLSAIDVPRHILRFVRGRDPRADAAVFEVRIRVRADGRKNLETGEHKIRDLAAALMPVVEPSQASLSLGRICRGRKPVAWRRCPRHMLSSDQLAQLWHLPKESVRPPQLATVHFREFEPTAHLPRPQRGQSVATLGDAVYRDKMLRCGLLADDRRRHLLLLGKTGMGKSTLLLHLLSSDIAAGRGVGLIDPHGDLAEAVLRSIPSPRTNDVVLFDAGDLEHPPAFNPLDCPDPRMRPLLAAGLVSSFKRVFGDSWGPRLEHILRNSVLAMLDVPGTTLVSLQRMLSDAGFRGDIVHRSNDPIVRGFWEREFAGMPARLQAEALSPVQNKVGHFVSNPILRHIVGQPKSRLDLRRIMDAGKVLLCNLSKGRIGDDASHLLGAFLVTSIQLAAMSRADLAENQRREFFLTVDEFGSFATESFASALSEARKYGLVLNLANQYLAQLEHSTRSAVFGNVGSLLVFQVGAEDSETLARQLGGEMTSHDLLQLPRYHAYARLLIEGTPADPFLLRTVAPISGQCDAIRAEIIRRVSRRNVGRSRQAVTEDILRTLA